VFECQKIVDLPSFYLAFGDYWLEVQPKNYAIEIDNTGQYCMLCLEPTAGREDWILGTTFLRGWYTIHDYDNSQIGFVPFAGSDKSSPEEVTEAPDTDIPSEQQSDDTYTNYEYSHD